MIVVNKSVTPSFLGVQQTKKISINLNKNLTMSIWYLPIMTLVLNSTASALITFPTAFL